MPMPKDKEITITVKPVYEAFDFQCLCAVLKSVEDQANRTSEAIYRVIDASAKLEKINPAKRKAVRR